MKKIIPLPKFSKEKISKVKKRDGSIVEFEQEKITEAIFKAITATGQGDGKRSKKLSERVVKILNRRFKKDEIPQVEQIQDIVEEILILEGLVETARAYILYREQRRRIREAAVVTDESSERIDQYLKELDWQVYENANMTFSLQGLNQYAIANISKKYWLNKIYPKEIREAAANEDMHIHDLESISTYCCGWDLYDLLKRGFRGVPGKLECRPAKHFRTALGQLVNFFFTLQGECYSKDTEVLTDSGWKYFYNVDKEDKVFTLNNENNGIELQKPIKFYEFDYDGDLYNFKSKKLDLLVTPNHNMVVDQYCPKCKGGNYRRKFIKAKNFNANEHFIPKQLDWEGKDNEWFYLPGIEILQYRNFKNSILDNTKLAFLSKTDIVPNRFSLSQPMWKYEIKKIDSKKILMDDWLKFFGFWLAEGCTSLRKRIRKERENPYHEYTVRISQNKGKTADEFESILKRLPFDYNKKDLDKKIEFVIGDKQLFSYLRQFGKAGDKFIPEEIKNLSKRQLKILFDWMMKGDGYIGNGNIEYYTKSEKLADDVQEIVLKLGYSANIYEKHKDKFKWYEVAVSRAKRFRFNKDNIKKVRYKDKVYCLEVPNHTLYVRREGRACWCGNSAGAQAVSNLDTLLAPFIRYDELSYLQVKQAMQEFLYNCMVPTRVGFQSLCWDELVVIKEKGKIKFKEIGKLIDREFKKNSHRVIEKHAQSYAVENHDDYQVLSFDEDGKAIWSKVKAFIRHKVPKDSEFVKIRTNRGEVKVSQAHSLFSFSEFDGKFNIRPKSAKDVKTVRNYYDLNPENHFIGLKSLENQGNKKELNLIEILNGTSYMQKNVFVKINPVRTLEAIRHNIFLDKQSLTPFYKEFGIKDRGVWQDWLRKKSIRYDIWQRYGDLNKEVEFKLRNSDIWYPKILKGEVLENFVKLCAWYITEGHTAISTPLYISQSPSEKSKEIINILNELNALGEIAENNNYSQGKESSGKVFKITGKGLLSEIISKNCDCSAFNKVIPSFIFELSDKYQKIFLETLLKGDASEYNNHWDFATSSKKLSSSLNLLLAQNNYRFSVYLEKTSEKNKNWHDKWIIRIYKKGTKDKKSYSVNDFEARPCLKLEKFKYEKEYEYDISVDLAQENFIGGGGLLAFHNTPFLNVTLDIKPPSFLAKQPVIIGGKPQKEIYGEFQQEMDMFIRAFYEGLMEGDAMGRPFTFPIPTVSITKDFDWDNLSLAPLWEATAKYGVNYFQNFIQSDMKPEDYRSMCFPANTKIIYKEGRHSRYKRTNIINLVNNWDPKKEFYLLMNGKWVKIKNSFKLKNSSGKIIKVTLRNGEIIRMTPDHPAMVVEKRELETMLAKDLREGDIIPIAKKSYEGNLGDFELGRWLGLYISEGGITKENTVYFSFNEKEKEFQEFVRNIAEKRFAFPVHITKDPRWETVQVWVKSKAAVEWVKKFCSGGHALEKYLLSSLYGMSRDFRLGALIGIYQGDGYERDVEFHTTNRRLRNDVADLARSIGINYTKRVNHNNTKGDKRFTSYVLRLCRDSLKELLKHFKNIRSSTSSIFEDFGGFYGIKIKSIKIQNYHGSVYDFEVDSKEHLFQLANGVITHNCCRLRLSNKELYKRGGGLFGSQPLTGSIGVVTINMPRIGYLSKTKKEFFERLGYLMNLAKESLVIKRKALDNFMEKGLYPYSKFYLESVKKMRHSYFGNHFSTIGLIGMNEAFLNFIEEDIGSQQGRKFALEVLDFMREKLIKYQEETGHLYNLEATPGEGTSYRQAKADKERYPDIITAGTKEAPYYTNSSQLPVNYTDDIFEALKLQDELQSKYSGGTVLHGFLGERINDPQMAKNLVKKIFENFHLPYITLTPTFSICPSHGYLSGEHFYCPKCTIKQPCEVYSRVVGYLRPVQQWHIGKRREFAERKEFKIKVE